MFGQKWMWVHQCLNDLTNREIATLTECEMLLVSEIIIYYKECHYLLNTNTAMFSFHLNFFLLANFS